MAVMRPLTGAPGDQDYKSIKSRLLSEGRLFEDPEFATNSRAIKRDGDASSYIRWRRPGVSVVFICDYVIFFGASELGA